MLNSQIFTFKTCAPHHHEILWIVKKHYALKVTSIFFILLVTVSRIQLTSHQYYMCRLVYLTYNCPGMVLHRIKHFFIMKHSRLSNFINKIFKTTLNNVSVVTMNAVVAASESSIDNATDFTDVALIFTDDQDSRRWWTRSQRGLERWIDWTSTK